MRIYLTGILLLTFGTLLFGQQPVVVPLEYNPALGGEYRPVMKRLGQNDTIDLPFFDDFSYYASSSYPDQSLWTDRFVFINNDYPNQPRSNGVATFDALDANGKIYKNNTAQFPADTLTSRPINLNSGMNGVYLSFYYQPQGYGDSPEAADSLILQFKLPETKQWRSVWNTPGTTLKPFKLVMIPVQGDYLDKGFQFRFVNMVSLEQGSDNPGKKGNVDHWHIDYVRLDKDRNENDTTALDVAIIAPIRSLIKGYQSIPWKQVEFAITTRLESEIAITYRNNDSVAHSVTRQFDITDVYKNNTISLESGGSENTGVDSIIIFSQEIANPFISTSVDSAMFELKGYLKTDDGDRKENDTVRYYQMFKNYFARDDGIPESGYGYMGNNAQNLSIACRYETFMPDTLQAVSLYFNPTLNDTTKRYVFKIAVWRDNNGRPGDQAYLSSEEYSPKVMGKFTTYVLERPVYVTKNYWIGWQQVTSGYLNVGFDRNYNDKGNLWQNGSGTWQQDLNNGTLMIRPSFGKRKDFPTSVVDPEMPGHNDPMKIYPNPASQYIRIEVETAPGTNSADYEVEILGQTGRLLYRTAYTSDMIDISRFTTGLYFVRLIHKKTGHTQVQKLLIYR